MTEQLSIVSSCEAAGAIFSPDRIYRYTLWRRWSGSGDVCWIMCNPSTADEVELDPTIRRCYRFSERWGYGGIRVVNIFALRSTDPSVLYSADDPIGPDNDRNVIAEAMDSAFVVAAWGIHGGLSGRGALVASLLWDQNVNLHALGFTVSGEPRHPLYLPSYLKPVGWSRPDLPRTRSPASGR